MTKSRASLDKTHDAGRERLNAVELDVMQAICLSLYDVDAVNKLFADIKQALSKAEIHLSIQQGINALQALAMRVLSKRSKNVERELDHWVQGYQALEAKAGSEFKRSAARQGKNITRSAMAGSAELDHVWGDEVDLRLVLSGLLTDPNDPNVLFLSNTAYVLPPSPLVEARAHAAINPVYDLRDQIKAVIAKSHHGRNIELLIPVTCSASHWQLMHVMINGGRVSHAALLDSMKGGKLEGSDSMLNAQLVVNKVNNDAKVPVQPVVTGKQTNGHSCMDYVVQEVLSLVADDHKDATHQAICRAETASELRLAVVGKIFENHPNLKLEKTASVATKLDVPSLPAKKKVVAPPAKKHVVAVPAKKKALDEVAGKVLANADVEVVHHNLASLKGNERQIQIKFDELLAKKLDALKSDSPENFKIAWGYAYREVLKLHGLFRAEAKTTAKAAADIEMARPETAKPR